MSSPFSVDPAGKPSPGRPWYQLQPPNSSLTTAGIVVSLIGVLCLVCCLMSALGLLAQRYGDWVEDTSEKNEP